MKPTLERSDQVVAHVVAWHNRHPLAQRITAEQVHSVGVVSLPFAVRGARLAVTAEAAPAPPAAEATAQPDPSPGADAGAAGDAAAAPGGLAVSPPDAEEPLVTGLPERPAELPPRPQPWHPRNWWARLRGRAPFHALFSEDFIAPLSPRQVRAWTARHGVGRRPLEPQAPQRLIVLDATRRRAGDDAPEVDLHLMTAAIGRGDSRQRLLLATDGAVLGRRQLNRTRATTAAAAALALLGGLGGGWFWHGGPHVAETVAQPVAPAASAVLAAASAAPAVAHAMPGPASAAPASAPAAQQAVAAAASVPHSVDPRRGRIELPPLVPRLAAAERQELRSHSREMRGQPAAGPATKAWALVTGPLSDRRQSERVSAQLHAIALLQPVPMRAELMPTGQGWRAVFWPFPTAQDAEKVRLALADKGLRTEVLEF
ncbi:MAG: hypothetical protein RJA10_70 [Pseudomonadota bacterium]|jgi:hypothetical protein